MTTSHHLRKFRMFKIFNFFRRPASAPASAPVPSFSGSVLPDSRHHTETQLELVRVVLKGTLRTHGIPATWLGCEVNILTDKSARGMVLARLTVLKWNEALLRYLPALQDQLIEGLDRFDPTVDHSGYLVSWQFSKDCECPVTSMPPPSFWFDGETAPALAPVSAALPAPFPVINHTPTAVAPAVKPKFDLPASAMDNVPSSFAPTEASPLFAPTEPHPLR